MARSSSTTATARWTSSSTWSAGTTDRLLTDRHPSQVVDRQDTPAPPGAAIAAERADALEGGAGPRQAPDHRTQAPKTARFGGLVILAFQDLGRHRGFLPLPSAGRVEADDVRSPGDLTRQFLASDGSQIGWDSLVLLDVLGNPLQGRPGRGEPLAPRPGSMHEDGTNQREHDKRRQRGQPEHEVHVEQDVDPRLAQIDELERSPPEEDPGPLEVTGPQDAGKRVLRLVHAGHPPFAPDPQDATALVDIGDSGRREDRLGLLLERGERGLIEAGQQPIVIGQEGKVGCRDPGRTEHEVRGQSDVPVVAEVADPRVATREALDGGRRLITRGA